MPLCNVTRIVLHFWLKGGIPFPLMVPTPHKVINMDLMAEEALHQKPEAGYQDVLTGLK